MAYGLISTIVLILVVVLLLNRRSSGSQSVYFYDLSAGQIVLAKSGDSSPAAQSSSRYPFPDGEAGAWVRAAIYSCGDVSTPIQAGMTLEEVAAAGARVVWLERYPTDVLGMIEKRRQGVELSTEEAERLSRAPILVATPGELAWVPKESSVGQKVMGSLGEFCPEGRPVFVTP
ncbi:MAG: hypothetical protein AAF911_06120 [Planctomycetota bacterium]